MTALGALFRSRTGIVGSRRGEGVQDRHDRQGKVIKAWAGCNGH